MSMNEWPIKSMTVLNKRFFESKAGGYLFVIDVLVPLKMANDRNGCFGFELKQIYLEKEEWVKLDRSVIGKIVDFTYGSDEFGSPVITGMKFREYLVTAK